MRHLDLFAGIGGFSLAARWMGWETVAQVEWDVWCQKVLAKNFPDALRFGDIVEFNKMLENGEITTDTISQSAGCKCGAACDKERRTDEDRGESIRQGDRETCTGGLNATDTGNGINIGHIDIITGGFPCQPFSHAGKRKGTDDSRYLWPAMLETIRRVKPSYVVGENVAGLVSMENGKTLDRILSDLEDEGYTTEQVIIPACAIGAWHRRDRIWIIAHSNGSRNAQSKLQYTNIPTGSNRCDRQIIPNPRLLRPEINEEQAAGVVECGEDASDAKNARTGKNNGGIRQGVSGVGRGEGSDNEDDAHRHNQGLQGRSETGGVRGSGEKRNQQSERYRQCLGRENGQSQSLVGVLADGLPSGLVRWDREPKGVPRVATGVKDRVNRLKGLGNAIVPAVALEIFKAIEQYELSLPR